MLFRHLIHSIVNMLSVSRMRFDPIFLPKCLLCREPISLTRILLFQVTVSDSGSPTLSSITRIVVQVSDINDETPVFTGIVVKFQGVQLWYD